MRFTPYRKGLAVGALGGLSLAAGASGIVVFLFQDITAGLWTLVAASAGVAGTWVMAKTEPDAEGVE